MTSNADRIRQARDNYVKQLEEISRSPKPTYNVDGQSYSWQAYQKFLTEQVASLNKLADDLEEGGDDFEFEVQAFT